MLEIHELIHGLEPGIHPRGLADPRTARDEKGSQTHLLALSRRLGPMQSRRQTSSVKNKLMRMEAAMIVEA